MVEATTTTTPTLLQRQHYQQHQGDTSEFKDNIYENPALFSGSTDLFRTAFGGYYNTTDIETGQVAEFSSDLSTPLNNIFDRVYYEQSQAVVDYNNLIRIILCQFV